VREPNFDNLLKVMRREEPDRPPLFEFMFNGTIAQKVVGTDAPTKDDGLAPLRFLIQAFKNIGYDYAKVPGADFAFPKGQAARIKSRSLNDGNVIFNREDFDAYEWPDPDACDYSRLELLAADLPDGMKLVVNCPGGVLENAIQLVGFERLCMWLVDEPDMVQELFDQVGSRITRYVQLAAQYDTVGCICSNDDWGFNTQTMLSPSQMRQYVFPWHKRIVAAAHAAGKPAMLHSCGNLELVMDDVIDDMQFDAKHSFEDNIEPVEDAYERYHDRIAILGGIDVDFVCRSTTDEVYQRSKAMLERTDGRGGYALGTGNSVPDYVPEENYFAMVCAATEG